MHSGKEISSRENNLGAGLFKPNKIQFRLSCFWHILMFILRYVVEVKLRYLCFARSLAAVDVSQL